MQYVLFRLALGEYGFDVQKVQEIVRSENYTKLPNTPEFIEGVINLRGKVMPVLNLAGKFGLPVEREDEKTRLIVLNLDESKQRSIAVKVAEVTEVRSIDKKFIEKPEDFIGKHNLLQGIAKLEERLVMLVDLKQLLNTEDYLSFLSNKEEIEFII